MPASKSGLGRARRIASGAMATICLVAVFLIAVVGGTLLHGNLPATQRTLLRRIDAVLDAAIAGRIVIDDVDALGFGTVRGATVRVVHPSGRQVISAQGVTARMDVGAFLHSLRAAGPLVIRLREAKVHRFDVLFDRAQNGELLLAQTFLPERKQPGRGGGRGVDFSIARAELDEGRAVASLDGKKLEGTLRAVRGDVRVQANAVEVNVRRAAARVRRVVGNADAMAMVDGSLRIVKGGPPLIVTRVRGRLGDVPVTANGALREGRLEAVLQVPRTPPEAIRRLWPAGPIKRSVAARVTVAGDAAKLDYRLRAEVGDATLVATGAARPLLRRIDAAFSLHRFDPRALAPNAPRLTVDAKGYAEGDLSEPNAPTAKARVAVEPFLLQGIRIPRADVEATLQNGRIRGRGVLHEQGARTDVSVEIVGSPRLSRIDVVRFQADSDIPKLDGVRRLGPIGTGAATIHATGVVQPRQKTIEAQLDAKLSNLSRPEVRAETVTVEGRALGALDNPRIDATLSATNVVARGFGFDRVTGTARGTLSDLDVSARGHGPEQSVDARGRLDAKNGFALKQAHVDVVRRGVQAKLDARSVESKHGTVSFGDIRVEGPADVELNGVWGPSEKHVRVRSDRIDLEPLGRAFDIPVKLGGAVAVDLDLRRTLRGWTGYVHAKGKGVRAGSVEDVAVRINTRIEQDRVDGQAFVDARGGSSAYVSVRDFSLPHAWSTDDLLDETTGQIQVEARLDLASLETLSAGTDYLLNADGSVILFARAERQARRQLPDLDVHFVTEDLTVSPARAPQTGREFALQKSLLEASTEKLEFQFRGRLDGSRREVRADTRLGDKQGAIGGATVVARLPATVGTLRSLSKPATLLATDLDAKLSVPERQIEELPNALRPAGLSGKISLAAGAHGKLSNPVLEAHGTVRNMRVGRVELGAPIELQFATLYEDPIADLRVRAMYQGAPVMDAEATLRTSARDWIAPQGNPPRWDASARAVLHGFPLESVSWLSDFRVTGLVKGNVSIDRLNSAPELAGDLAIERLRVGNIRYDDTRATIRAADGHLSANLDVRQNEGKLSARLESGLDWRDPLTPALDVGSGLDLEAHAIRFEIGGIQPFVAEMFSRIGGKLYADVDYAVRDGKTLPTGTAYLRDGVVQVPSIGQEFQDVRFDAVLDEKGGLRVNDASARGLTGRVTAEGQAKFSGLTLEEAKADLVIRKGQEIPITVQGVSLGRAWGRLLVRAAPDARSERIVVNVRVPRLHVELPRNIGRQIQSLGEAPAIEVGVHKTTGRFESLPLQPLEADETGASAPTKFLVDVALGNDVWIRRPNLFEVKLGGGPKVLVNHETTMLGQIFLKEGSVDVLGKKFSIVDGTVTFRREQPDNPIVVATARWDSPEGYTVFADFTGPVESGTLALRSNPSLTESEILGLLVFGSPEGQVATAQQSGGLASGAAGVGGGIATMGLNRALGKLSEREITTRLDTSAAGGPRPEVAMQVTRRLAVELAYNPAPSLLTREPDHALLTLMFRIKPRWMLQTTVGDAGTSVLDLIWRYRY